MEATLQGIFTSQFAQYAQGKRLPLREHKAAQAIIRCRTEAMGGHEQRCPDGHVARVQYHSCKHRSCPRCAALPKAQWVEGQQARLLACDHYHVVFTLPHELLTLWSWNRSWFVDALFQASRDTLLTLLKDERHLGTLPGIVMALHTWGRSLNLHPHMHCLVSGGGLSPSGEWKSVERGYLLPVRVVKALYKGKLLARLWTALKDGTLRVPTGHTRASVERVLKAVGKKSWNVCIQDRYAHGRGVMLYLSRYVKGGPMHDRRVLSANEAETCFRYKDHRDGKNKIMSLPTDHFLERVLWHVPEPGQHTIRHYGLYAHQAKPKRAICRQALGQAPEEQRIGSLAWAQFLEQFGPLKVSRCRECGKRLVRGYLIGPRRTKNSIVKVYGGGSVQQDVQPDAPSYTFGTDPPALAVGTRFFLGRGAPVN